MSIMPGLVCWQYVDVSTPQWHVPRMLLTHHFISADDSYEEQRGLSALTVNFTLVLSGATRMMRV